MAEQEGNRQHISQQFNAELNTATKHLLEMGGVVQSQVSEAVGAFVERDSGDAQAVIDSDRTINAMEVAIDDECFRILARRQPTARDLRLVLAISKANADLERVGDEASRIARQAIAKSELTDADTEHRFVTAISGIVTEMLRGALDAFARRDAQAALAIARGNEEIDIHLSEAMAVLAEGMRTDPVTVAASIVVMWVLRSLERVGDHARNIAEHVIYIVEGVDVRHAELDQVLEWLPER